MRRFRRGVIAAAMVAGTLAMIAGPAAADPGQGKGLHADSFTCNGQEITVDSGSGAAGFVNGDVYLLTSITGTVNGEVVFSKTWGNRNGSGDPISCTGSPDGVLQLSLTAVPVPAA